VLAFTGIARYAVNVTMATPANETSNRKRRCLNTRWHLWLTF
jgi:hypothetical protein